MRDLPIVLISAYQPSMLTSPRTVTFQSFLANFNNAALPGGGHTGGGVLDSGIFTCMTPGYYTVSFSAYSAMGPRFGPQSMYLYKNGSRLSESWWFSLIDDQTLNTNIGFTSSRILVSSFLDMFALKLPNVKSLFLQILHMDYGDTLELRMTQGDYIGYITFNIELTGLGFDYLV